MDKQTQIGIGAASLFTLAGASAPLVNWWVSLPIMMLLAAIGIWGFWPIFETAKLAGWPFGRLSLREAAQIAYENAEAFGLASIAYGAASSPTARLQQMADLVAVQDMQFYGRKPPFSRVTPITIGKDEHPIVETNELMDATRRSVIAANISVSRWDFNRFLRGLRMQGRGAKFARQ